MLEIEFNDLKNKKLTYVLEAKIFCDDCGRFVCSFYDIPGFMLQKFRDDEIICDNCRYNSKPTGWRSILRADK